MVLGIEIYGTIPGLAPHGVCCQYDPTLQSRNVSSVGAAISGEFVRRRSKGEGRRPGASKANGRSFLGSLAWPFQSSFPLHRDLCRCRLFPREQLSPLPIPPPPSPSLFLAGPFCAARSLPISILPTSLFLQHRAKDQGGSQSQDTSDSHSPPL